MEDNLELHRSCAYLVAKRNESRNQRARTYQGNNLTNGTVLPVEIYDRTDDSYLHLCAILSVSFGTRVGRFLVIGDRFQFLRPSTDIGRFHRKTGQNCNLSFLNLMKFEEVEQK